MKIITKSLVPNLLTLVNLFCGFTAIIYSSENDYFKAALFILIAAIFDMFDGVAARLIGAASEFGAELDSLCDLVSFGVAPSMMLYKIYFYQFAETGILLSSLPALAGAARLARFNVQVTGFEDKLYFKGLPIPSGALTIVSYILFYHIGSIIQEQYKSPLIFIVVIVTSLAMISTIKFDNLPRPNKKSIKERPIVFALFLIGILTSIFTYGDAVFPFMMVYIFGSAIRQIIRYFSEKYEPEDEISDADDSESNLF